jgi:hypothetical protein
MGELAEGARVILAELLRIADQEMPSYCVSSDTPHTCVMLVADNATPDSLCCVKETLRCADM